MDFGTLFVLAAALSMDAFAVAICKGLALKKITVGNCLIVGLWFGGFQGLMPFIGFLLGNHFAGVIESVSAWIAFILLAVIGGNMIREAFAKEEEAESSSLKFREMLLLAIATSIDALAVGITFACIPVKVFHGAGLLVNTLAGCIMIACTTCVISMAGVKIGSVFGTKYKNKAEFAGGTVLILIGLKIMLEHFGIF